MLDRAFVREHLEEVEAMLRRRGMSVNLGRLRELDERRRELIQRGDQLKQERNRGSEEVARLKRGQERDSPAAAELIARNRTLGGEIAALDRETRQLDEEVEPILLSLPNLPAAATPVGATAADNVEVNRRRNCRTGTGDGAAAL